MALTFIQTSQWLWEVGENIKVNILTETHLHLSWGVSTAVETTTWDNLIKAISQTLQAKSPGSDGKRKVLKVSVGTTDVNISSWLQERTSPECYPIVSCEALFMTRSLNPSLDSDPTVGHQTWFLQQGRHRRNAESKTKNCTCLFIDITWRSLSSFSLFSNL